MFRFNFNNTSKYYSKEEYEEVISKKDYIKDKLYNSNMSGWLNKPSNSLIESIKDTSSYIKNNYDLVVSIGIGGSYLSSYSFTNIFKSYYNDGMFPVIFTGYDISSRNISELMNYLDNKNFCINVISKSGNTMESIITYKLLKEYIINKYGIDELKRRVIITTNKDNGYFKSEVDKYSYRSFIIPDNIGGRYSFISPGHLLILSLNFDIEHIIAYYYRGLNLFDMAYEYASRRYLLYRHGKVVENYIFNEERMTYLGEFLRQLFCETEGKNGRGILTDYSLYSRDLHSIGQYIQEGNKIVFETYIIGREVKYNKIVDNISLNHINDAIIEASEIAHSKGGVPYMEINMDQVNISNISTLICFFHLSSAISGYLFGINPFNQPGVEEYKKEINKLLEGGD